MSYKLFKSVIILFLLISLIMLAFCFPNYYAFKSSSKEMVFSGQAFWFDPWDINVYVATINWSQKFGFDFQNAYTTLAHKPTHLYLFYTLLGMLFAKTNPFLIYHLALILLGFCLLFMMYKVAKGLLFKETESFFGLLLTALGGGFGWVFYPKLFLPDIGLTPFTFTSTFQRPHEILGTTLYLLSLYLFYQGINSKKITKIINSSILAGLLSLQYPFYLLSYYLIGGVYSLSQALKSRSKQPLFLILVSILITLPIGAFYSFYLLSSKGFENVLSPNLPTPNIFSLSLGYGSLFFISLYQLFQKGKDRALVFLNLWFFLSLLISYLPTGFGRYYLRGLFFPLVILSIKSLDQIPKKIKLSKNTLLKILLIIVPLSSLLIFWQRLIWSKDVKNRWYFISKEEQQVLDFLKQETPAGSGVLSAYPLGNKIPAFTYNRVYFGHHYHTPNSKEKIENLNKFFGNQLSEIEALNFLKKNNIAYVLWGPDEKLITARLSGKDNLEYDFLKTTYSNPSATIYHY